MQLLNQKSGINYILEKELVKLLFEGNKEIIELIFNQFSPDDFNYQYHQNLVSAVYEVYQDSEDLSSKFIGRKS